MSQQSSTNGDKLLARMQDECSGVPYDTVSTRSDMITVSLYVCGRPGMCRNIRILLTINADVDAELTEQRILFYLNAAPTHAVYLHLPAESCYAQRPVSDLLLGRWRPGAQLLCVHLARDEQRKVVYDEVRQLRAGFEEARKASEGGRPDVGDTNTATIRLRFEQDEPFEWSEVVWREQTYTVPLSDRPADVFGRQLVNGIMGLQIADTALSAKAELDKQVLSIDSNLDRISRCGLAS